MDPVMPFNTTSAPDPAMATTASGPAVISTLPAPACFNASRSAFAELSLKTATFETWNCAACWARSSTWEPPAASPTTSKRSRWREMTSRPWVPMDPVDPRMTTVEVCMGYAYAPYCFVCSCERENRLTVTPACSVRLPIQKRGTTGREYRHPDCCWALRTSD